MNRRISQEKIEFINSLLRLWDTRNHDPPLPETMNIQPIADSEFTYDYTYSQLPPVDYQLQ